MRDVGLPGTTPLLEDGGVEPPGKARMVGGIHSPPESIEEFHKLSWFVIQRILREM